MSTETHRRVQAEEAEKPSELTIEVAALSDVGCQRTNNEDSFGYDLGLQLFVVCDGMGGMAAGEVASRTAVDQMLSLYGELNSSAMATERRLHHAIRCTNRAVWTAAQNDEHLRGMGTTLVAACVDGDRIVVGNVGDSRAYFLRDGSCIQITQDHSWAVERAHCEIPREANPDDHWLRQFVTRAIGAESTVQPDLFFAQIQPGDLILLATDGLSRYADSGEIGRRVRRDQSLADSCRDLIQIARDQGAADNVTCLLLRIL